MKKVLLSLVLCLVFSTTLMAAIVTNAELDATNKYLILTAKVEGGCPIKNFQLVQRQKCEVVYAADGGPSAEGINCEANLIEHRDTGCLASLASAERIERKIVFPLSKKSVKKYSGKNLMIYGDPSGVHGNLESFVLINMP